jgi:outer membrane protein assembly factor BamD
MKTNKLLYISAVLILFSACSGYEKVVKSNDFALKYNEAKRYYAKEDYYRAQVLYDQIAPIYRGTEKADTIYYYQAMCYYKQADYIMAGHYFEAFSKVYGASPFVEEAVFMSAFCYYQVSPRPELDQQFTKRAIQSFQKYLLKYPKGEKHDEAVEYVKELRDKLVEKSFISARLYFDLEDYKASLVALNNSLLEYPESKHREDLMFMVFKSSYKYAEKSVFIKKQERYQSALDEYYSFKAEFPESKYMREADRYYAAALKNLGNEIEETDEFEIN